MHYSCLILVNEWLDTRYEVQDFIYVHVASLLTHMFTVLVFRLPQSRPFTFPRFPMVLVVILHLSGIPVIFASLVPYIVYFNFFSVLKSTTVNVFIYITCSSELILCVQTWIFTLLTQ